MSEQESPYLRSCAFCDQGLVRFYRCRACGGVAAICDECELIWVDFAALRAGGAAADSAFPTCPKCRARTGEWSRLTLQEIEQLQLDGYLAGES